MTATSTRPAWTRSHPRFALLSALILSVVLFAPSRPTRAQAPNPTLDGTAFDVLVFDGAFVSTHRLGGRTHLVVHDETNATLEVLSRTTSGVLAGVASSARVLLNDGPPLGNGWPEARPGATPSYSMVGLDLPMFDGLGTAPALGPLVSPRPGSYPRPTRVRIDIVGGSGQAPEIQVTHNGVTITVNAPSTSLNLGVGTHTLSIVVTRGGVAAAPVNATFIITPPTDPLADTDGDGVSDLIEAAAGLDALVADADRDTDGDGVSNLDEVLRGCPPGVIAVDDIGDYPLCDCDGSVTPVTCKPADTDEDGWFDLDESWRSTQADNRYSYPVARTLYEVELHLTLGAFSAPGVLATGAFALEATDLRGAELPTRRGDGFELGGAVNHPPDALHPSLLPNNNGLRLPGDLPAVVRLREWNVPADTSVPPTPRPFAVKAMVPTVGQFSPTDLLDAMRDASLAPSDLAAFRTAASGLFTTRLRKVATIAATPQSTWQAAQVEALASWQVGVDGDEWLALGVIPNNDLGVLAPAVDAIAARYGAASRDEATRLGDTDSPVFDEVAAETLSRLITDLGPLTFDPATPNVDASLATLYALTTTPGGWPDTHAEAADLELGKRLQVDTIYLAARTWHRLFLYIGPRLYSYSPAQRTLLADPNGDFDNDTKTQSQELSGPAERATDPTRADTDGDNDPDASDPCPVDPADLCWPALAAVADRDGDGIADGLDNCPNVSNGWTFDVDGLVDLTAPVAQSDADGDGVGDACEGLATIMRPRSHQNVVTGTTLVFTAEATGDFALGDLTLEWDFGGAAPTAFGPSANVTFVTAGTFVVTLTATYIDTGWYTSSDVRFIGVRGAPPPDPVVTLTLPSGLVEGMSGVFTATATEGPNTFTWTFGDGGNATGHEVSHTYPSQGVYPVSASATNVAGRTGVATGNVTVADSGPALSRTVVPTGLDRELRFTDTSVAYDGITSVSWLVLETNQTASGSVATFTFPFPGQFALRQTTTDGDGTSAQATFPVNVTGSGMQLIRATIDGTWQTFNFPRAMASPVVVAGVPTALDPEPGVVEVRNVTTTGFEARFAEWDYLDGVHGDELIAFFAMERGDYLGADGRTWFADSALIGGPGVLTRVDFDDRRSRPPVLVVTAQTHTDPRPFMTRLIEPSRRGFRVALYHEEALAGQTRGPETIGWVGVTAPGGQGTVTVDGVEVEWRILGARLNHQWRRRGDFDLRLGEEQSADVESRHPFEVADFFIIDGELFGGTVSLDNLDPFTVQRGE